VNLTIALDKVNNMKKFFEEMASSKKYGAEFTYMEAPRAEQAEFQAYRDEILSNQTPSNEPIAEEKE
jgi:hypothetical protein